MTDIREQEMQKPHRFADLGEGKPPQRKYLSQRTDCSVEKVGFWLTHGENEKDSGRGRGNQSFRRS